MIDEERKPLRRRVADELRYVADLVEGRTASMRAAGAVETIDQLERGEQAADLAEAALRRTDGCSGIWSDADYLCGILSVLTADADRARAALLARRSEN